MKGVGKRNTVDSDKFLREEELPQNFEEVLNSQELRDKLLTYLKTCLAEENLLFFESVERFERLVSQEKRNKMGLQMIRNFVEENSIYWINISAGARTTLCDLQEFSPESFSAAKREVFELMSSNFFERFKTHLRGVEFEDRASVGNHSRTDSFENFSRALGELNATLDFGDENTEENQDSENVLDIRRTRIESGLQKAKKKWRFSLSNAATRAVVNQQSMMSAETGTKMVAKKRAKNAFKRMFTKSSKNRGRTMSFWQDYEDC